MSQQSEYTKKITRYDRRGLRQLWQAIVAGQTPGWEPGKAFEYLVLRPFQLEGAKVRWPYSVSLGGDEIEQIDGVVYADGLACLVECKDQAVPVNVEPIAKLRNQLLRRPGTVTGLVFSRYGFTEPALTLARFTVPQTILLWTGEEIELALQKKCMRAGLLAKYHYCVEQGFPDFSLLEALL